MGGRRLPPNQILLVIGKDSTVVIEGFSRDFRIFVAEINEPYLSHCGVVVRICLELLLQKCIGMLMLGGAENIDASHTKRSHRTHPEQNSL